MSAYPQWETSSNGKDWDVCEAGGGDMVADLAGIDDGEAKATLIARSVNVAPKLAEALRAVSESAGKTHLPHRGAVYVVPPDVIEAARAALAEWDAQ